MRTASLALLLASAAGRGSDEAGEGVAPPTPDGRQLASADSWVYSAQPGMLGSRSDQAATWPGVCASGKAQSPINIDTSKVVVDMGLDESLLPWMPPVPVRPTNTGRGAQLHLTGELPDRPECKAGGPFSRFGYDSPKFTLKQLHWHAPSEHTIDGRHAAMECHFVHELDEGVDEHRLGGSATGSTWQPIGVIALLFELDAKCNPTLAKFWDALPMEPGTSAPAIDNIDLVQLLNMPLNGGFWRWKGSLTTPPCTEGVEWRLVRTPVPVCQAQLDKLVEMLKKGQKGVGVNNRAIQPRNGRTVYATKATAKEAAAALPLLGPVDTQMPDGEPSHLDATADAAVEARRKEALASKPAGRRRAKRKGGKPRLAQKSQ